MDKGADTSEQPHHQASHLCRGLPSLLLCTASAEQDGTEFGHDIAKLVLCLAGMNTIDLYELKKEDYKCGRFCYKRAKTRHSRKDEAYFEMRIEPVIMPLIEKYKADDASPYFFNFHTRYSSADSFCANVNNGIKKICKSIGLPKEKWYSVYTFRHSWATIAASLDIPKETIAAALGHSSHTVTDIYIEFDYRKVDEANLRVLNWVLYVYEGGYAPQEVEKHVPTMLSLREAKSSRNVVGFEFGKMV